MTSCSPEVSVVVMLGAVMLVGAAAVPALSAADLACACGKASSYAADMEAPLCVAFAGGATGPWRVNRLEAVRGEGLPVVERLSVHESRPTPSPEGAVWALRGVTSNERYVTRAEHNALVERQPPLGRPEATSAALIPVRKNGQWWDLPQDERLAIFEERSQHVGIGLEYLPAVARRLHHGRDLGEEFDFLTWFEYAPTDAKAFEELVTRLRATEEWAYVEREMDIRLTWEAETPRRDRIPRGDKPTV
jgi:Chlorite dismutase